MKMFTKNLFLILVVSLFSTSSQAIDPVEGAKNRALTEALKAAERREKKFKILALAFFQDAGYMPTQQEINNYVRAKEIKYKKTQRARQQRLNRENHNPNTDN